MNLAKRRRTGGLLPFLSTLSLSVGALGCLALTAPSTVHHTDQPEMRLALNPPEDMVESMLSPYLVAYPKILAGLLLGLVPLLLIVLVAVPLIAKVPIASARLVTGLTRQTIIHIVVACVWLLPWCMFLGAGLGIAVALEALYADGSNTSMPLLLPCVPLLGIGVIGLKPTPTVLLGGPLPLTIGRAALPDVQPRLFEIVHTAASRLKVPEPDNIILSIERNFSIGYAERNMLHDGITLSGITLKIAMPLLTCLSEQELTASIAHELAHLANGDFKILSECNAAKEQIQAWLDAVGKDTRSGWMGKLKLSYLQSCVDASKLRA